MKYGTFLCWAFGHKFAKWLFDEKWEARTFELFDNCVRCGLPKDVMDYATKAINRPHSTKD